jgi:hypothetical protein
MNRAGEIGIPSFLRLGVAHPDNGLGSQMKDDLGFDFSNHLTYLFGMPNIDKPGF